jgi:copper resistance protein C
MSAGQDHHQARTDRDSVWANDQGASRSSWRKLTMRRIALALFVTLPLLFLARGEAIAHAALDRASPSAGSTVATAPTEVALWFTQNLEPKLSSVTVTDGAGQQVDTGSADISGNVMRVSLKALGPGTYNVNWRVLSVDTHSTQGSFTFRVGK